MRHLKSAVAALLILMAALVPFPASYADQGSLCMPTTGTVSGLAFSQNVNAALQALVTSNSGGSAPVNPCSLATETGQIWLDTSTTPSPLKLYDGTAFETVGVMDASTGNWTPPIGGGAESVASATTTDLWSVPQSYVVVTGTTTITALAGASSAVVGTMKTVSFSGALILTYDATQLILPGGRSFTTAVGDKAQVIALGGGNVAVVDYTPASGMTLQPVPTGHVDQFLLASCPALWVDAAGNTIGDASSGATRANADTEALFTAMWALSASASPILTSAGAASTRGASAAADFAAHKRLTIPDMRAQFLRGLDNGRGVDTGRALGTAQAFATSASGVSASSSASSTFTGSALPGHSHTTTLNIAIGYDGPSAPDWAQGDSGFSPTAVNTNSVSAGTPSGSVSTSVSTSLSGASETRPANVAVLMCVKL